MYPVELEIKDTTESNTSAFHFDLLEGTVSFSLRFQIVGINPVIDNNNFKRPKDNPCTVKSLWESRVTLRLIHS